MKFKNIIATMAITLTLSACTTDNTASNLSTSSQLSSFYGFDGLDEVVMTPSRLMAETKHIIAGEITDVKISRTVEIKGSGEVWELCSLIVRVDQVDLGGIPKEAVVYVELLPLDELIVSDLKPLVVGKQVVLYANDAPVEDSTHHYVNLDVPDSSAHLLQMTGPYGVVVAYQEEGKLVWPLLAKSVDGVVRDVMPGGTIMSGSKYPF